MVKQPGLFSPKFGATSRTFSCSGRKTSQQNPKFTVWPIGTGTSRYHNFCIDGGTSPEDFGYHLVFNMDTSKQPLAVTLFPPHDSV
jgi:hypothetical protein